MSLKDLVLLFLVTSTANAMGTPGTMRQRGGASNRPLEHTFERRLVIGEGMDAVKQAARKLAERAPKEGEHYLRVKERAATIERRFGSDAADAYTTSQLGARVYHGLPERAKSAVKEQAARIEKSHGPTAARDFVERSYESHNRAFIERAMNQGYRITDIGKDGRHLPSRYREAELKAIRTRDYERYELRPELRGSTEKPRSGR